MKAIRSLSALPRPLSILCGPTLYQPTREKKLFACEAALQTLPQILPKEQWASTFHMWHDDLHAENIFVDADNPTAITAIIDWQSTHIVPMFDHTVTPEFLDYDGPVMQRMERPEPPSLQEGMDPEAEAAALALFDEQILASGYKHLLKENIKPLFDAVMYSECEESGVLGASRNIFELNEVYCLGFISTMENSPVRFSEAELAMIEQDMEKTAASISAMCAIKTALGPLFPEKGIVRPEDYEKSKVALKTIKAQVLEDFSTSPEDRRVWEEEWPFDDRSNAC